MARHRLSRDQVIWAFGPDLEPVLEIEPGDVVTFETNDCFTGQITSEADLVTDIDLGRINSATGPVAVRGAEPGDSLVAEILDVRPVEWGVATLIPGFGQLSGLVAGARDADVPGAGRDGEDERQDLVPGETDGRRRRRRDRRRDARDRARGAARRQPRRPLARQGIAHLLSRCVSRAGCSPSATCTRRWATARSASPASRSRARSTSASMCSSGKQATWPVTELDDRWVPHAIGARLRRRARARLGGGCQAPRRPARLHDRGRVHLPLGRLRRRRCAGVQAGGGFRHDRALLDSEDRRLPGAVPRLVGRQEPVFSHTETCLVLSAVNGSRVPVAPALAQRHPREPRHQVELRRPHVAERDRVDPERRRPSRSSDARSGPGATTSYSSKPSRVGVTVNGRIVSPAGSRCRSGSITSITKHPPGSRCAAAFSEARDLRVLRGQVHDRVEDEVGDREAALDRGRREIADRDADLLGAGLGLQPRHHRLREVDAVHADAALCQRQRDPAGADARARAPHRRLRGRR